MKQIQESKLHWADEKEIVHTNIPLKIMVFLLKYMPAFFVRLLVYPISFFYMIFSSRARNESKSYQKILKDYTNGEIPKKISAYKQIVSFAFCLLEKIQGWLGQIKFKTIEYQNDDIDILLNQLKQNKGAVLITSHQGNVELLRSLADNNKELVGHDVPIVAIMETKTTQKFNDTVANINSKAAMNLIDPAAIGPDTICTLMDFIENGALVIIAGDRTSAHSRGKFLTKIFLGKPAPFPYGTFLIPFLIKSPVYYMFGLRSKTSIFEPKYKIYIEKSDINLECAKNEREKSISDLCSEYVQKTEKFCKLYPYQWYNFFNFWNFSE